MGTPSAGTSRELPPAAVTIRTSSILDAASSLTRRYFDRTILIYFPLLIAIMGAYVDYRGQSYGLIRRPPGVSLRRISVKDIPFRPSSPPFLASSPCLPRSPICPLIIDTRLTSNRAGPCIFLPKE